MTTWLSRIMAAVFTLNVLAPVDLLAQNAPARRSPSAPQVDARRVEQVTQEQYEQYQASIQEEYANADNVFKLYAALEKLHNPAVKKPVKIDFASVMKEQEGIPPKFLPDTSMVNPRYTAYMMSKGFAEIRQESQEAEALLKRITSAQEPWENLMLYLDPIPGAPDSLMASIVVAEIMGNTVDSDMAEDMGMDLLELQLRAIFRLRALEQRSYSGGDEYSPKTRQNELLKIQAIGTLRMLLLKVQQYYARAGKENPLFERAKQQVRTPAKPKQTSRVVYTDMIQPISLNIPSTQPATVEKQLFSPAMYGQMMSQFLAKLREMKAAEPKPNSAESEHMALWADFAVAYAMMYSPNTLAEIVGMFDGGPKATDFEQPYTTLLSLIFQVIRESLQYSPIKGSSANALALLPRFSDPQKYSVPTRIFALEAASILYQQHDEQERKIALNLFQEENELLGAWFNSFTPDIQTQVLMAARTVDLYDSLTRYRYETYGLDSKQMQELSDKLAKIYNGFANADLKTNIPAGEKVSPYNVAYSSSGKLVVANAANEIPRLSTSLSNPQQFQVSNGSLKNVAGLGRKSDGRWIEMHMYNAENPAKVKRDTDLKILTFIGEVVLWVWGGEILSLIGRSFRVARGATLALPKAVSAASTAQKGHRMLAFSVEVQKGARMAQLPGKLARNGVTMVYARTPKPAGPKATTTALQQAGAVSGSAPKPLYSAVRSSAQLQNKYAWYNPKRWFGIERQPITEIQFSQVNPGFRITSGRMSVMPGSDLSLHGIRTYDDWRRVRGGLEMFNAPGAPARINFYDFFGRKQLQQEMRLMNWAQSSAKAGAFDAWLPTRNGYWNFTGHGPIAVMPEEALAMEEFFGRNMLIAPRGQLPGRALITQAESSALKDVVPVTVADVVAGNWAPAVAQHYFKAVEWNNPVTRWLMPKYVPSKAFLSNFSANPLHFGRIAGSRALMSTRFVPGVLGNTVFFGSWMGLDYAINPAMQSWITDTAEDEVERAKQQFGDAYDPERLKEDDAATAEVLESLREQGFVPPSSSVVNDVRGAMNPSPEGALFAFPFLAARQGLSKTSIGRWAGITTPFMNDGTRTQLQIGANRIQAQRWVRKYQNAKNQKDLDAYYKQVMDNIKLLEADYAQFFEQMAQQDPGSQVWARQRQKLGALMSSFKQSFEQSYRGEGNVSAKFEKMNAAVNRFASQREQFEQSLRGVVQTEQTKQAEDLYLLQVISMQEVSREADKTTLREEGYAEAQPQLLEQVDSIYQDTVEKLRKIQKKNIPFEQKIAEMESCLAAKQTALQSILPQQEQEMQPAANLSKEQLRDLLFQDLDASAKEAGRMGIDVSSLVQEWKAAILDCYAKTETSQEFMTALEPLYATMTKKWEKLFADSRNPVQQEDEPDNSELYPDVTTY